MSDVRFIPDLRDFERATLQYMALSRKLPHEVANHDARDVGLKAVQLTKSAGADRIRADLAEPSRVNPKVTVADVLAGQQRISKKQLIALRVKGNNVVRAGWLNGVKRMPAEKGRSSFVPRMRTSKKLGDGKPGVTINGQAEASIWNNWGQGNDKISTIQAAGLEKAKAATYFNRLEYIERKQSALNRSV